MRGRAGLGVSIAYIPARFCETTGKHGVDGKMSVIKDQHIGDSFGYRCGMELYRSAASTFFSLGGKRWLKKKIPQGFQERMGFYEGTLPEKAFWVHASSVGEVQAAAAFLDLVKKRSAFPGLLSTVTRTGRAMAEQTAGHAVDRMIYAPLDIPRIVRRTLDAVKPSVYVAMEAERWPCILAELKRRGIPAFLVNGRLSDKSAARLAAQQSFWKGVLCCFRLIMVRFESDKEKFLSLGVPENRLLVTGDCKIDTMTTRKTAVDTALENRLRRGEAPLFLAGSTHRGEEETVCQAFEEIRDGNERTRLIIVPRKPERAAEVAALASRYGKTTLYSKLSTSGEEWDIAVVDAVGVLFGLYAVADAAFIGGSLIPHGGQNIMEAGLFEKQVTHGPHMRNFPDAARMDAMGAALSVGNAEELARAWRKSLHQDRKIVTAEACRKYFKTVGGASERSWEAISSFLRHCRPIY